METRFLQKFTKGIVKANQKLQEEETREKTKGYEQSKKAPDPSQLHARALEEARKEKAEQYENEAIENEAYMKEYFKAKKEVEKNTTNGEESWRRNRQEEGYSEHPQEALENLEEEAEETEEYWKTHPQEQKEMREEDGQSSRSSSSWHAEEDALENEKYFNYPKKKNTFYQPQIPKKPVSDYDTPRLWTGKEDAMQSQKSFAAGQKEQSMSSQSQNTLDSEQESPAIPQSREPFQNKEQGESLPLQPLSQYIHMASTTLPSPLLQKSKTRGFIKPLSKEEIPDTKAGLIQIRQLIKDHAVTYISCPGPLRPIAIRKMGAVETVSIVLDEQGISQVIKEFSEASRIPYMEGLFKAVVGDLMITAVITEIGSRFTITRIMQ